ncbi:unnamed protein product [Paramecium pentaurelia]|uniref:Uncharacterized protein n=1 Tax=Paramecium pentaurelia TaxID=43138 RepID=A0A8S1UQP9_9CILI|nr:unnamed protein product [Paramecium pentaurelia]
MRKRVDKFIQMQKHIDLKRENKVQSILKRMQLRICHKIKISSQKSKIRRLLQQCNSCIYRSDSMISPISRVELKFTIRQQELLQPQCNSQAIHQMNFRNQLIYSKPLFKNFNQLLKQ